MDTVARVAQNQPLDVNALLSGATPSQATPGSGAGIGQGGEGIDANAIINGLTGAQQGSSAKAATAGQAQTASGSVAGSQQGAGIDANAIINSLAGAQQGSKAASAAGGEGGINANAIINGLAGAQQGGSNTNVAAALGSSISGQTGGDIDANAIINGLTGAQTGGNNGGAAAAQGQGQTPTSPLLVAAGQLQQSSKAEGLDANALLNGLAQGTKGQGQQGAQSNAPSVGDILQGLQDQKGQAGNGVEVIQIKETIVQQINGAGEAKKTIVESAGGAAAANATVSKFGFDIWIFLTLRRLHGSPNLPSCSPYSDLLRVLV